jgi:hypothetical protein
LTALPGLLLAALSRLLALLARLLLSAAALLSALATLLSALVLLAGLLIRVLVHNCSCVSSLATTKPRPLSFLRTLVRKRTLRPSKPRVGVWSQLRSFVIAEQGTLYLLVLADAKRGWNFLRESRVVTAPMNGGSAAMTLRTEVPGSVLEENQSAVSWAAIAAGGVAAAALTLVLLVFGAGMGFSSISPWSDSGISSATFNIAAGIYLIVVAMLSSTIGGYVAGRLRTKWTGLHTDEVAFRDTAHGFLAWAFATVLGAAVLGAATTYVVGGVASGAAQVAAQSAAGSQSSAGATEYFVDMLLRPAQGSQSTPSAQPSADPTVRREIGRIFARSLREGRDFSAADRTYLAQVVTARTGINQAEAEKRVSDVINQAKVATDEARKAAAKSALWLTAAMLVGAFAAALAAIEGGQLRDGTWKGVIGGRNYPSQRVT